MAVAAAEALAAATAQVDHYCVGAPDRDSQLVAVNRLARWIERYPSDGISNVSHSDQNVSWSKSEMASGIMLSGAAALLCQWRRPRGRVIEMAP